MRILERGLAAVLLALVALAAQAETVKVGIIKTMGYPAVPIGLARGYFEAQRIGVDLVYFESAEPVAVGVASGAADFGAAGMTAGLLTLAGHGELRFIASSSLEHRGFHALAYLASNKAWDAGLTSPEDFAGHSVAITQLGTTLHYGIAAAADKFGFPLSSVTVRPLQSNGAVVAALKGGTVDAAVLPGAPAAAAAAKGDAKIIGWVSDTLTDYSTGAVLFARTAVANEKGDLVRRFLIAYREGMRDFHDAFVSSDGKPAMGPDAPAILQIMSKFTGIAPDQLMTAITYVDRDGRISTADVARQIAWYQSQRLLKRDVTAEALIDRRYALPLN